MDSFPTSLRTIAGLQPLIDLETLATVVSPHMFRRTVATAVHAHAGVDLAAELLGHADPRITVQHYIRRNEMVNPTTADILEAAFPPLPEEE